MGKAKGNADLRTYSAPWFSRPQWYGCKWIRPLKRLAIYLRDGLACVYCGKGIEHGAKLTLDHLRPRSRAWKHKTVNHAHNLVTACDRCNKQRGDKPLERFVPDITLIKLIVQQARKRLPLDLARRLLSERGAGRSCASVVESLAADSCLTVVRAESQN